MKPGQLFAARYEIEGLLGEGGMGQVYRALDRTLARSVALKVLSPGSDGSQGQARLLREARAAAAFSHPGAVSVYDVGEHEGAPYIAMELVEGVSLRRLIGEPSTTLEAKVRVLVEMARALGAAHRAGLVHRDVKPDNVMVRPDGSVKVLDFGIARLAHRPIDTDAPTQDGALATLTQQGSTVGTPRYMAPEQIGGDAVDARADQFAWGVTAYELLTGATPFSGHDAFSLVKAILTQTPRPIGQLSPSLPPAIDAVVQRALAKSPAERYPSIDDAADALSQAARGEAVSADRPGVSLAAVGGAAAGALALAAAGAVLKGRAERRKGSRVAWAAAAVAVAVLGAGALRRAREADVPGAASSAQAAASLPRASAAAPMASVGTVFPCNKSKKPGVDTAHGCSEEGVVSWCDGAGRWVACCGEGLVPVGDEGLCACPPGGDREKKRAECPITNEVVESSSLVQRVVRKSFGEIRGCYEAALSTNKAIGGKVVLYFEISPDGSLFYARVNEASLPDPGAQRCVLSVIKGLRFSPPGGVLDVVYPISFAPGE